MCVVFEVSN